MTTRVFRLRGSQAVFFLPFALLFGVLCLERHPSSSSVTSLFLLCSVQSRMTPARTKCLFRVSLAFGTMCKPKDQYVTPATNSALPADLCIRLFVFYMSAMFWFCVEKISKTHTSTSTHNGHTHTHTTGTHTRITCLPACLPA